MINFTVLSLMGSSFTFLVGLLLGLKKNINLQKTKYLKEEIYEPFYRNLIDIEQSIDNFEISSIKLNYFFELDK